ncbi:c-type cytochrome biogenesis protein CcmI [Variovorax rhizosphaerae]|uniref:C-type cytochrome biogenesis protein CcmI n=1 Tax=Variovorax rhizosphaerae TaxID=1836200 RepID=A0ABU8WU29_9BURK
MIGFWCGTVGLTLLAWVMLFGPGLGRRGRSDGVDNPNLETLKHQLSTLDAELVAGVIDAGEHRTARSETQRRVLQEASPLSLDVPAVARIPALRRLAMWLAICIPVAAFGTYGFVGSLDGARQGPAPSTPLPGALPTDEVASMLDDMTRRMQDQPPGTVDAKGWAFVARSYAAIQRYDNASQAYALALALAPDDTSLQAERARVAASIAADGSASTPGHISGTIKLAPELAALVGPTDTVFVFAREAGATGMPLAAARFLARHLPLAYTLDDKAAMGDANKLARAKNLVVYARISHSGEAIASAGDLHGESAANGASRDAVDVTISKVGR